MIRVFAYSEKFNFSQKNSMGNPIFVDKIPATEKAKSIRDEQRTYASVAGTRRNQNSDVSITLSNDHPIRNLLSNHSSRILPTTLEQREEPYPESVDALEEMIIRQLRPRSFSLLFGNPVTNEVQEVINEQNSMETVMGRLRRQLRSSTARLAQEVALTHRQRNDNDSRDRLEMDRMMRRVRQERRSDTILFHSAFYRWNMVRGETNGPAEDLLEIDSETHDATVQPPRNRRRTQLNASRESDYFERQAANFIRMTNQRSLARDNSHSGR